MISFITESGSIYDAELLEGRSGRIRRLTGTNAPTDRQGPDGEWKDFFHLSPVLVGGGVLICWNDKGQCTFTSNVERVWETDES